MIGNAGERKAVGAYKGGCSDLCKKLSTKGFDRLHERIEAGDYSDAAFRFIFGRDPSD